MEQKSLKKERNGKRLICAFLAFVMAFCLLISSGGPFLGIRSSAAAEETTGNTGAATETTTKAATETTTKAATATTKAATTAQETTATQKTTDGTSLRDFIIVGDSRSLGLYYTLHPDAKKALSGSPEHPETDLSLSLFTTETLTDGQKVTWSVKNGSGYTWMKETGVPQMESAVTSNSDVFIMVGVNDIKDASLKQSYIDYLNEKGAAWAAKGARVFFVSVLPLGNKNGVIEYPRTRNSQNEPDSVIRTWNSTIADGLSGNVTYFDMASLIGPSYATFDDLHYTDTTNETIWRLLREKSAGTVSAPDSDYTGLYTSLNGTVSVSTGKTDTSLSGLKKVDGSYRFFKNGKVLSSANGLQKLDSTWRIYNYGSWASTVSGLFKNKNGWYYCKNGVVDFDYNGVASNYNGTYYVKNGKVDFSVNNLAKCGGNWYLFKKGRVETSKTGLYKNDYGWWYVEKGKINFNYDGVATNKNGTYYVEDSKVDFSINGLAQRGKNWYLFKKGRVETDKTGLYKNDYGWWYVKNGKVDFNYNGMAKNQYGNWVVQKGKVNFNYNGYYTSGTSLYDIKDGKQSSYTGTKTKGKFKYTFSKGKVTILRCNVPQTSQMPKYPTGCEGSSMQSLLKYYGFNVSIDDTIASIPRENVVTKNGKRYGPSIYEKFAGDPTQDYTSASPGYGAFSPVITKSLNAEIKKLGGGHTATNITGVSAAKLYEYLNKGHPLIVWATSNMMTPTQKNSWYVKGKDGKYTLFSYPRGTHVMILCGYDKTKDTILTMDSYNGIFKSFDRETFESKYELLGKQAIIIDK